MTDTSTRISLIASTLLVTSLSATPVLANWYVNQSEGYYKPTEYYNDKYGDFPPADIDEKLFSHLNTPTDVKENTTAVTTPPVVPSADPAPIQQPLNPTPNYSGQNYQQPAYNNYNRGRNFATPGNQNANRNTSFNGPWNNNRNNNGSSFSGPWNNNGSSFSGPWNNNRNNNGNSFSAPWNNNGSNFSMPWGGNNGSTPWSGNWGGNRGGNRGNNSSGFNPMGNGGSWGW